MRKLILLIPILLAGCGPMHGNPYAKFFQPMCDQEFPPVENVTVIKGNRESMEAIRRSGKTILGKSSFSGRYCDQENAVKMAKHIGADLLLISIDYSRTRQGTLTIPQFHPGSTVYAGATAGAATYGSAAVAASAVQVQTPGYTTYQTVPYSVEIYNHSACFVRSAPDEDPYAFLFEDQKAAVPTPQEEQRRNNKAIWNQINTVIKTELDKYPTTREGDVRTAAIAKVIDQLGKMNRTYGDEDIARICKLVAHGTPMTLDGETDWDALGFVPNDSGIGTVTLDTPSDPWAAFVPDGEFQDTTSNGVR